MGRARSTHGEGEECIQGSGRKILKEVISTKTRA
jgi:hypothetical protein